MGRGTLGWPLDPPGGLSLIHFSDETSNVNSIRFGSGIRVLDKTMHSTCVENIT